MDEISEELNSRGVFAATKYKYTNKASMHNLLKNRRYMGEYRYGDTVTPDRRAERGLGRMRRGVFF